MKVLMFVIWMIDVFNISFNVCGVDVATFLDYTVPVNFWFWFIFWLLCPTTRDIKVSK